MEKTIKLSKETQKACEILKGIETLVGEYRTTFDKMKAEGKGLMGALVVSIYSPLARVGFTAEVGSGVVVEGLKEGLAEKESEGPMVGLLGKLK